MKESTRKTLSRVNHVAGLILYIFMIIYGIMSLTSIIINATTLGVGGVILNLLALFFEIVGPVYAIYFMVQLLDGSLKVGKIEYDKDKVTNETFVSVIVPIHNVDKNILDDTLEGLNNQTYPKEMYEVWIGDDTLDPELRKAYKEICDKYGFIYYYEPNDRFKAHMINLILPKTKGDMICFFDVDHIPVKDALFKFIAILEQHQQFSFVQGKFSFRNANNALRVWEAMSMAQMFASQNGRRKSKTVMFQGSSACFRRDAVLELPEGVKTEDFTHTVKLLSEGKIGYFLDEKVSVSLVPETIGHQMSQLYRWMCGQTGAVFQHPKELFNSKMTIKQAIDIIFSSTIVLVATSFYFLGIIYAIIYGLKIPLFRALGINELALIVMPVLTFVVYIITLTATTIYTNKSRTFPLKLWHIPFFLTFGSLTAPFLLVPVMAGVLGQNKLEPGKEGSWNKKLPLKRWGAFYSLVGILFTGLTAISLLDFFGIIHWMGVNYYFILFGVIGLTLIWVYPFVIGSELFFKPTNYEQTKVYH